MACRINLPPGVKSSLRDTTLTPQVLDYVRTLGADLAGVAAVEGLRARTSPEQDPLHLLPSARSVVVFGLAMDKGFLRSRDDKLKNFVVAQICRQLDTLSLQVARFLAARGEAVAVIPSNVPTPLKGFKGYLSLRHVAQEAGLGEIGLSQCFLSYEFGPRVYLGAVLTSAELEAGRPQNRDLCAEAHCHAACAEACPAQAIVPQGGHDKKKCQERAQTAGLRRFLKHLHAIVTAQDAARQGELIFNPLTYQIWESFLSHVGAYGGCFRCLEVCPVGHKASHHAQA